MSAITEMELMCRERAKKARRAEKKLVKRLNGTDKLIERIEQVDLARTIYERMERKVRKARKDEERDAIPIPVWDTQ